ncbi:MAG: PspA/IM30 family protein [Acidobacteriales bacterium]|nr:PspA/IM30 family protein [Terriglobales bacterium]
MALMERVSTLVRANLNDLIDKAEDPEKLLRQVLLDMQNQLMQLKTQVAIAIADQHLLEKKRGEYIAKAAEWQRKAEMAVRKQDDALARAALERKLAVEQMAQNFESQVADQRIEVENLKSGLRQLEAKMEEAQGRVDLLVAQHRRSRILAKANRVREAADGQGQVMAFDRMRRKVEKGEAVTKASGEVLSIEEESRIEERFRKLEQEEKIDLLLEEIKRRPLLEG